eukprot:369268-Prymnesium_polylepis.3
MLPHLGRRLGLHVDDGNSVLDRETARRPHDARLIVLPLRSARQRWMWLGRTHCDHHRDVRGGERQQPIANGSDAVLRLTVGDGRVPRRRAAITSQPRQARRDHPLRRLLTEQLAGPSIRPHRARAADPVEPLRRLQASQQGLLREDLAERVDEQVLRRPRTRIGLRALIRSKLSREHRVQRRPIVATGGSKPQRARAVEDAQVVVRPVTNGARLGGGDLDVVHAAQLTWPRARTPLGASGSAPSRRDPWDKSWCARGQHATPCAARIGSSDNEQARAETRAPEAARRSWASIRHIARPLRCRLKSRCATACGRSRWMRRCPSRSQRLGRTSPLRPQMPALRSPRPRPRRARSLRIARPRLHWLRPKRAARRPSNSGSGPRGQARAHTRRLGGPEVGHSRQVQRGPSDASCVAHAQRSRGAPRRPRSATRNARCRTRGT